MRSRILLIAAAAALAGCGRGSDPAQPAEAKSAPAPVQVKTARAEARIIPVAVEATGSFVAKESSDVAPETEGQVQATPVDVGAFVRQGAVLVRLDDKDARLRVEQARAAVQQAEAALRQAEARVGMARGERFNEQSVPEVAAARANYEAALAQARLASADERRYASLHQTGDVARTVFEQAQTRAKTAQAQAEAARKQYEAALNTVARQGVEGIAAARGGLNAARAQLAIAEKALADTAVRAPFSGYVSARPVAAGEYVSRSTKVATVVKIQPLKLELRVPEAEATRVRRGLTVSASVQAHSGRRFTGRVTAVNPAVDPNSRAMTVEATFDNADGLLLPGMFASAAIEQPQGEPAVFVPRPAVLSQANTESFSVYEIVNSVARLRVVQLGKAQGEAVRIASGLNAGAVVATTNLARLYDGARVQVR